MLRIGKMWTWYERAVECYVHLSDVPSTDTQDDEWWSTFSNSQWFRRGWTLQELLAPHRLVFYDREWTQISTIMKHETDHLDIVRGYAVSFVERLIRITRIPWNALITSGCVHSHSIAARMGWAAGRSLTRDEDVAYCLLGLFNINMPLLYGEGSMAFFRLQREIIAQTDDQSILTWRKPCEADLRGLLRSETGPLCSSTGILAPHPSYFEDCGNVIHSHSWYPDYREEVETRHSITNKGLELSVVAARIASKVTLYGMHGQFDIHLLRLRCWRIREPGLPCTVALVCEASPSNHAGPLRAVFRALTCDFLSDLSKCSPADLLLYGEKLRVHTAHGNLEMLGNFSWKLTQFYIALV